MFNFCSLPQEILDEVAYNLELKDITQLKLLNHYWYDISWRYIFELYGEEILEHMRNKDKKVLSKKFGKWISKSSWYSSISKFKLHLKGMPNLKWVKYLLVNPSCWINFVKFMKSNRLNLYRLDLEFRFVIDGCIPNLKANSLKELFINLNSMGSPTMQLEFIEAIDLKKLELDTEEISLGLILDLQLRFINLKELILKGNIIDLNDTIQFVGFKELVNLQLDVLDSKSLNLVDFLSNHFNLKQFLFYGYSNASKQFMIDILSNSSLNLNSLNFLCFFELDFIKFNLFHHLYQLHIKFSVGYEYHISIILTKLKQLKKIHFEGEIRDEEFSFEHITLNQLSHFSISNLNIGSHFIRWLCKQNNLIKLKTFPNLNTHLITIINDLPNNVYFPCLTKVDIKDASSHFVEWVKKSAPCLSQLVC